MKQLEIRDQNVDVSHILSQAPWQELKLPQPYWPLPEMFVVFLRFFLEDLAGANMEFLDGILQIHEDSQVVLDKIQLNLLV